MTGITAPLNRHPGLDPGLGLATSARTSQAPDQVRGDEIGSARSTDPALARAAQGFEQIFLRQMIGAMRAGSLGDPLFGSNSEAQFRDLFDARLAENMAAQGGGLGIGTLLMTQLRQRGQAG